MPSGDVVTLRLLPSLVEEARKVAGEEGVALDQIVNAALAEKLSVLRGDAYLRERAARGDPGRALAILGKAGRDNPPVPGDGLAD